MAALIVLGLLVIVSEAQGQGRKFPRYPVVCGEPDRDCTWKNWADWSSCSVKCGKGTRTRNRDKIKRQCRGAKCQGPPMEQEPCFIDCEECLGKGEVLACTNNQCECVCDVGWIKHLDWDSCAPIKCDLKKKLDLCGSNTFCIPDDPNKTRQRGATCACLPGFFPVDDDSGDCEQ